MFAKEVRHSLWNSAVTRDKVFRVLIFALLGLRGAI